LQSGTSTRVYRSPRRAAGAAETRAAVLEAAAREFAAHGYARSTLAGIARRADVSLATVKLVGGPKPRLLVAALEAIVRAGAADVPLVDQPWWRSLLAEPDSHRLLERFGVAVSATLERQADLLQAVAEGALVDPELASLEMTASEGRRQDLRTLAEELARRRALRADVTVDEAADTMWAIASPAVYRLMVGPGDWSTSEWGRWLGAIVARGILA
jgi:AcrR family transcriptional regulator